MTAPPLHPVDVFLVLVDGDRILLGLRRNTGFADGQWNLPSGKLEAGEDVVSAVIREAQEEVGIQVRPGDVRLAATVHYRGSPTHARPPLTSGRQRGRGRRSRLGDYPGSRVLVTRISTTRSG